jgi:hypothetical protein
VSDNYSGNIHWLTESGSAGNPAKHRQLRGFELAARRNEAHRAKEDPDFLQLVAGFFSPSIAR